MTAILEMILLYRMLGKRFKRLRTRDLMVSGTKATIASLIMGGAAYISYRLIDAQIGNASKLTQLIGIGIPITIAIVIYVGAAYLLKMPELEYVINMVKRKVKRA
jgi:putative peptidoglycan lipid II flippase